MNPPKLKRLPAFSWMLALVTLGIVAVERGPLAQVAPTFSEAPVKLSGGSWRLRWVSEAGVSYRLERSPDLVTWGEVTTLLASGEVAEHTDTTVPPTADKIFWRAVRLGGGDVTPPTVSILQARRLADSGESFLELTVQAADNIAVVGVNFTEGQTLLGAATEGPTATWKRIVPLDEQSLDPRQFQAAARDAAGNTGFSDIYTYRPEIQNPALLPIDEAGQALADSLVGQRPDGSLNPFTLLPDANGGGSAGHGFRVDYVDGGQLVTENGRTFAASHRLRFRFGAESPVQLADGDGVLEVDLPAGETRRLALGEVSFAEVAAAMGVDPAAGIALEVFGFFELVWKGGTLTQEGIRGGLFELRKPGINFGANLLGGYENFVLDLVDGDSITLPLVGELPLGEQAKLSISRARPLALTLRADGEVSLRGGADLVFTDGARFAVEVLLDDPNYCLTLRAGNLEFPLIDSMADLLPNDPLDCVRAGFDEAALDEAEQCLRAYERVYRLFLAAARGQRPAGVGDSVIQNVPSAVDLTGAAVDAWASLKAVDLIASVPTQPLLDAVEALNRQARNGVSDPATTLEAVAILIQLGREIATLQSADQPQIEAAIQAAIVAAKPALLKALRDPAVLSREVFGDLVFSLASGFFDFDAELSLAADGLLKRAVAQEAAAVGVLAGVTDAAANPKLAAMNFYSALAVARRLIDVELAAERAGLSVLELPLFNECMQQIFDHGYSTILAAADRAVNERNPKGLLLFIAELSELTALDQKTDFTITAAPTTAQITALLASCETLMLQAVGAIPQVNANDPVTREQVFSLTAEFRSALEIAARLPAGETSARSIAAILFERLETQLPLASNAITLATTSDVDALFTTLAAGAAHAQLKRRDAALSGTFDWEGPAVSEVAARISALAVAAGDTAMLDRLVALLMNEADLLEAQAFANPAQANALRQARKRYFVVTAEVLEALHPLTQSEWLTTEQRRGADPAAVSADGFLPGDLKIDQPFGTICHNRLTQVTRGTLGGELRLPKLASSLSIQNASLDSDGRFDLNASGVLSLPGEPDSPFVTMTVPRSQPLHIAIAPGLAPVIEGRAKLSFANGSFVGVGLRFADPIYSLQAEAGGLQFDLRDAVQAINSPQLGSLNVSSLWADYYDGFSSWLEGFEEEEAPGAVETPGEVPSYVSHIEFDVAPLLEAWLARAGAEVADGSAAFVSGTSATFQDLLKQFDDGLAQLGTAFGTLFPPNAEQRANDLSKRLEEIGKLDRMLGELLDEMARQQLAGGDGFDAAGVEDHFAKTKQIIDDAIATVGSDLELLKNPELVEKVSNAALNSAAGRQLVGLPEDDLLEDAQALAEDGLRLYAQSKGLLPNGEVFSPHLNLLSAAEAEEALSALIRQHSRAALLGSPDGLPPAHLSGLAKRMVDATLATANFDEDTGVIDDGLADETLLEAVRQLHKAVFEISPLLQTPLTLDPDFSFSTFLWSKELVERAKKLPEDKWYARYKFIEAAQKVGELRLAAGGAALSDPVLSTEKQRVLAEFNRQARGRLKSEEIEYMRFLKSQLGEPEVRTGYETRLLSATDGIAAEFSRTWTEQDLALGRELLAELAMIDSLLTPAVALQANRQPAVMIAELSAKMRDVAEPLEKGAVLAQVASESLKQTTADSEMVAIRAAMGPNNAAIYDTVASDLIIPAASPAFALASKAQANELLNGSRAVLAVRAANATPPSVADMGLAGELTVDRVFGGFFYHRVTGFFQGTFGGKLSFPDPRASFEISQATFNNQGGFAIAAAASIPVKVLENDRATLSGSLAVAGGPSGLQNVSGSGLLTVPTTPTETQTFSGSFGYDGNAPGKPLSFTAAFGGAANELRLSDDLVIFEGNLGVAFGTDRPVLSIEAGGKAGLFERDDVPAALLTELGREAGFWAVCDVDALKLLSDATKMRVSIEGGTLDLAADLFEKEDTAPNANQRVKFSFSGELGAEIPFATGIPTFFADGDVNAPFDVSGGGFGFGVPGIQDSKITVNTCELRLFGDRLPILRELDATFCFPLPGQDASDPSERVPEFRLNVVDWGIDGFMPQGVSVTMESGLDIVSLDGFGLEILGTDSNVAGIPATALSFEQLVDGGEKFTRMSLTGGLRARFSNELLSVDPSVIPTAPAGQAVETTGALRVAASGEFVWDFRPNTFPSFEIGVLQVDGRFRLGSSALALGGAEPGPDSFATLRIPNLSNITRRSAAAPFEVSIAGALDIPEVGKFVLNGARFVWDVPDAVAPKFFTNGGGVVLGDSLNTLLGDAMPVYLKELNLELKNDALPLFGGPPGEGLLDPKNLKLTVSAEVSLPPAGPSGAPAEGPRFGGLVDGFSIEFPTGDLLAPKMTADTVALGIENLDIPPLAGISGQVALVNLGALGESPPRPDLVTFVGNLEAKFSGKGAGVLLAAKPTGIVGACFSVDTSPAGIPLDGGVLGGILWVGAEGGLNFKNQFSNPCNFREYLNEDGNGNITSTDDFDAPNDPRATANGLVDPLDSPDEKPASVTVPEGQPFDPFDCLKDNWPPKSANPLCEEFPAESGRFVFRGTRLSSAAADDFLDRIGLSANSTQTPDEIISAFISEMLGDVQQQALLGLNAIFDNPEQPPLPNEAKVREHFDALTQTITDSFDDVARPILRGILQPVSGGDPNVSARQRLHELLTQGIPCFNVTFVGSGTFTHAAVSAALGVKGTVSASTTGAAMAKGELLLAGIPVAEASMGVSLTNETGKIAPFLGGLAQVALGPLDMGKLTMSATVPDSTAVLDHFADFIGCVDVSLTNSAKSHLQLLIQNVKGGDFVYPSGVPIQDFVSLQMTEAERLSLIANLFNTVIRTATAIDDPLTTDVDERAVLLAQVQMLETDLLSLIECFEIFVADTMNSLSPEICFGGKVSPSIFDIPMTASGEPIFSARMRYGRALNGNGDFINPADPALKGVSASVQFSPTFMLLSPLTGLFVAANPTNAPLAGFTAVDSADMSMSFLIPGWTPEKVRDFLTNQPKFYSDRAREFFDTAVFGAGYEMRPFGMELADAELRLLFPQSTLHPLNPSRPGGPWVHPQRDRRTAESTLPTRDELILAALQADQLSNADFRGEVGELDDLFPAAGSPPPAAGCATKVQQVANDLRAVDPDLADLAGKSFAADYFPHGGMIGAGQLALPKILTRGLPPEIARLAVVPADATAAGAWLTDLQTVLEFLAQSDCVGQLGFYLPAPNPLLLPGEVPSDLANLPIDQYLKRLQIDPLAMIGRTANSDLYPFDEIVFTGWANAAILGLPIGEAFVNYDPDKRCFLAEAQIPANTDNDENWLNDFVQANAKLEIKLPSGQEGEGVKATGLADVFAQVQTELPQILALSGSSQSEKIEELRNVLFAEMPKISLEVGGEFTTPGTVNLPAELGQFAANASLGLFAFSPYYEPDFELGNDRPYAQARRNGGIGIKGSMTLGYFPEPNEPAFFSVSVPDASFAVKLSQDPVPVPSFVANLEVADITLPQVFSFDGQDSVPFQFKDGRLFVDTGAPVGGNSMLISGMLTPIDLGPFLDVNPLPAAANPENLLGGELRVIRTANGQAVDLSLNAAQVSMPLLGSLNGTIFGEKLPNGDFTPFTFSTFPGQNWQASMELNGAIELRDPFGFAPSDEVLFRATPPSGQAMAGSISGTGIEEFTLRMSITNGWTVELFPGKPHGSRFVIGDSSSSCLYVRSDGRFYYDSGTRIIPLGGLDPATAPATVQGRVEFGYNPAAPVPTITASTISGFSAANGSMTERNLTVTASGAPARGHVVVDASIGSSNTTFSVSPSRQIIPAGESRTFKVRYTPRSNSSTSATLSIAPEGQNSITRSLFGSVPFAANLHFSETSVDFGTIPVGQTTAKTVRINNLGNTSATVTIPAATAPFSRGPTSFFILAGAFADLPLTFAPTAAGAASQSLTLTTTDANQPEVILSLSGNTTTSPIVWRRIRAGDGSDPLQAVAVRLGSPGVIMAGGEGGTFLTNEGTAFAWRRNSLAGGRDVNDLLIPSTTLGWAVGANGLVLKSTDGGINWSKFNNTVANAQDWQAVATISSSTGFIAICGKAKGKNDGFIVRQTAATTFADAVIPAGTPLLHGIAFSSSTTGIAVGLNRTILRTTNGGANWSSISAPASVPAGTALRSVAAFGSVLIAVGDGGIVLRSANSGASWTQLSLSTTQNLNDVSSLTTSQFWTIVGEGGTVFTSLNSTTWTKEDIESAENLTAAQAFALSVLVSEAGDIFIRGGGSSTALASVSNHLNAEHFSGMITGQRAHGEMIVTNAGGAPLTATLASSNSAAWPITPAGLQTIPPGGSLRFSVHHTFTGSSSANTLTLTTSDTTLPTFTTALNAAAKPGVNVPVAYLHGPASVDFGTVAPGVLTSANLTLENLGLAIAGNWRYSIRSNSPTGTFSLVSNSTSILSAGATRTITARFQSSTPGLHRAIIEIQTDSWNGILPIEVRALVATPPTDLVVTANQPNAQLFLEDETGTSFVQFSSPAIFQVIDGPSDIPNFKIERGKTFVVSANPSVPFTNVDYQFKEWTGGTSNNATIIAGSSPRVMNATYVRSVPVAAAPPAPTFRAPTCTPEPPADSPNGPWFKLSEARLSTLWLGASGTDFKIEGAAFASLNRFSASLTSSRIRVTVPNHPSMLFYKNGELLEVTPGSWRFSLTSNALFTEATFNLSADQPGLQVLNKNVLPPASFALNLQTNPSGPLGTAAVSFSTTDDLVLLPQILALGPVALSGEIGLNASQPVFTLSGSASWKALAQPGGAYTFSRSGSFSFDPRLPAIAPLAVPENTEFDLLVAKFRAGAGANIGLGVSGTAFNLQANNWEVRPFGSDTEIAVSVSAATDGSFSLDGSFPETGFLPFAGAPLKLVPVSDSVTDFSIRTAPLAGTLKFSSPALYVNSTSVPTLWTSNRVTIPEFEFDSSNFQRRLPLPSINFNGFVNEADTSPDADNFVELAATPTTSRFTLRSRQRMILGTLKLEFDHSDTSTTSPVLSAGLHGRLGLENPDPFNRLSDQVSLIYNSATPRFELNRTFFLSGGRFKLTTSGSSINGQACLLTPNAGAISTWAEAACFP